jgi:YdjC-like protein
MMKNKRYCKIYCALILIICFYQNLTFGQDQINLLMRADDMGGSFDRNLAIIKAHKEGIITSASIMPTTPFFNEAVQLCKETPSLVVGIHITLLGSKTRSVLSPDIVPSIVTPAGFLYETMDQLNNANPKCDEIEKEIRAQIGKVRATGLHFVYLDYHRAIPEIVKEIIIKICHEQHLIYGMNINGSIYNYKIITLMRETWPNQLLQNGQLIYYSAPPFNKKQEQSFFDALTNLKPGKWMTIVHPGLDGSQRSSVTKLLCSPKTKEIIKKKKIRLVSYYDLWKEEYGDSKRQ